MFSRTAEYAVRAVLMLAQHTGTEPLSTDELAAALGAPRNYLGKTLNALVRSGLLHSARGPHGGFTLAVSPERLSLAEIVDLFTEPRARGNKCIMGNRTCNPEAPCAAHERWTDVTVRARAPLMRTTISELMGISTLSLSDALVADHTGAIVVEAGRNPIQKGTKS